MQIDETCSCGATFSITYDGYRLTFAEQKVEQWRAEHRHTEPVTLTAVEEAAPDRPAHWGAFIWAHPGRMSGAPCIGGTRIDVATVVGMSLDEAIEGYDLTAEEYHLADWFTRTFAWRDNQRAKEDFYTATEGGR